jgi:RimJ/RimL family protein N-acetyltransferase
MQFVYQSHLPIATSERIDGFKFVEVNEKLFRELKNTDFVIQYIEQYWGIVENYLGKGYGYVALTEDDEAVSIAVSSAVYQSTHAIGVETLEDYRRKGLSSSLVTLLVDKLKEKNIAVWWDCMESNIASQKTAEKAGLVRSHTYKVNWFTF